jgi:MYXO-CTERM domain-containing protein
MRRLAWLLVPALLLVSRRARAADDTVAGAVTTPFPTLHNVSIEWAITGDDDADGVVTVRYRKQGDATFRDGLPLFRVPAGSNQGFSWANRHAGSVFGLEAGTTYELELTLTDPDGGSATESATVTTRAEPAAMPGAPLTNVDPSTIDAALAAAAPGDVLVLGDGTYGEIVVPNDGAPGMPIVLRAASPAAVVEGDVRIDGRSYVIVEGLTVHGKLKFNDAESITVRGCTIETPDDGIVSYGSGVYNATIVDNVITGATLWYEGALGVSGDNVGEGVQITGAGNVVAFNRVRGFRDCLSLLEDGEAVSQISDDFYGNDLEACADDAIEADFAMGNVRVYGNRIARSFMGLSSQPSLGGPTYFIRNVMYGVAFQAFKLQRSSVGDVGLHNTVIKPGDAFSVNTTDVFSRAWFRNNLFLGGPGGTYNGYDAGPGDVMQLPSADASCSFDYDGFGSVGTGAFAGRVGGSTFASFAEMQSSTTEVHAVEVGLSDFAASPAFPADPFAAPPVPSFALAPGGAPIDKGTVLANVNDGYSGALPDLGALELGAPEPVYGPGGTLPTGAGGGGTGGASSGAGGGTGAGAGASSGGDGAADGGGDGCGCAVPASSGPRYGMLAALVVAGLAAVRRRWKTGGES